MAWDVERVSCAICRHHSRRLRLLEWQLLVLATVSFSGHGPKNARSDCRCSTSLLLLVFDAAERSVLAGQYIVMLKEDLNDDADFQENR